MRATVVGILMASDAPESFMSSAYIQAVCYRGAERNAAYQLDAKDIAGPLDVQITDACRFVERNMRVFAVKSPKRIETPQFSMNAVFEALVNAVARCRLMPSAASGTSSWIDAARGFRSSSPKA